MSPPFALILTFGNVEATAVWSSGSNVSIMDVEIWEKIKALPNARDIIRSERKSEFNYVGPAYFNSPKKEKIIAAVSLNTVLAGDTFVIDFHITKSTMVDIVLGVDFYGIFNPSLMTANYLQWYRGSETVRAYFLRSPELKVKKRDEQGNKVEFIFSVRAFV